MNETRTTIRCNAHKLIDAIFASATACRAYDLQSGFVGVDCDASVARSTYESMRRSGCKPGFRYEHEAKPLRDGGSRPPRYVVRIHMSLWYEIEAPAPAMLRQRRAA